MWTFTLCVKSAHTAIVQLSRLIRLPRSRFKTAVRETPLKTVARETTDSWATFCVNSCFYFVYFRKASMVFGETEFWGVVMHSQSGEINSEYCEPEPCKQYWVNCCILFVKFGRRLIWQSFRRVFGAGGNELFWSHLKQCSQFCKNTTDLLVYCGKSKVKENVYSGCNLGRRIVSTCKNAA